MKQILVLVILISSLAVAGFYIKFLRSEMNVLENSVNVQTKQIDKMVKRAQISEKISQERENEIEILNQSQKDFQDELQKAKLNEDFKNWFDNSLPLDAKRLLKKNTSN